MIQVITIPSTMTIKTHFTSRVSVTGPPHVIRSKRDGETLFRPVSPSARGCGHLKVQV
jgi:hypothetical protein